MSPWKKDLVRELTDERRATLHAFATAVRDRRLSFNEFQTMVVELAEQDRYLYDVLRARTYPLIRELTKGKAGTPTQLVTKVWTEQALELAELTL